STRWTMPARRSPQERWRRQSRSRRATWDESPSRAQRSYCTANRCLLTRRSRLSWSRRPNNRMPKLNIGLIGVGRLGRVYARDLSTRIACTRLTAIADPDGAALERVRGEFDVPHAYADSADL